MSRRPHVAIRPERRRNLLDLILAFLSSTTAFRAALLLVVLVVPLYQLFSRS